MQIVASYFLLIPLRDEMSVLLGTNTLPALFASSLVVSMLSQPVTSYIITSAPSGSLSGGIHRFFNIVACVLTGFALAVAVINFPRTSTLTSSVHLPSSTSATFVRFDHTSKRMALSNVAPQLATTAVRVKAIKSRGMHAAHRGAQIISRLAQRERHDASGIESESLTNEPQFRRLHAEQQDVMQSTTAHPKLMVPPVSPATSDSPSSTTFSVGTGDSTLTFARRCFFITFYLWMSTQNLISASVLWARCADIFQGAAAERVFGVLAAAATAGQLLGATSVALLCRNCSHSLPMGVCRLASLWFTLVLLAASCLASALDMWTLSLASCIAR